MHPGGEFQKIFVVPPCFVVPFFAAYPNKRIHILFTFWGLTFIGRFQGVSENMAING